MGLDDYAQALGAAQRLVPDWQAGDIQNAQLQGLRLQNQAGQVALQDHTADRAYQDQQRAAFQTGLANLGAKPTAQNYRALAVQFPQFHAAIDGAAKGMDAEHAATLVRHLAPVQSLISAGLYDKAAAEVKRHIDADVAAGGKPDESDQELYDHLTDADPQVRKAAGGIAFALLNQLNPETAAKNLSEQSGAYTLAPGSKRFDAGGNLIASADFAPDRFTLSPGETRYNGEGGDLASGGGAAGTGGDVSRLINSNAGGGYLPEGVKTAGQFVAFGKSLNRQGAKSSSAGTYQINGSTMAEFGPKALGSDWAQAPFDATTQDKVGEAIFDWSKRQPDPAAALRARWVSLSPSTAARLVSGSWEQARGTIAQGETGGGPGASAAARGGARVVGVGAAKPGYQMLSPTETEAAGLDPNVKYQRSPDGQITALGGQSKAQLKPIPQAAFKIIADNRDTLRQIDSAISAVKARPGSIGPGTGALGDTFTQYHDPDGTDTRAALGKIAGQIIHDVSGAAVTLSEEPRFKPYVPTVTDKPSVAIAKLKRLRALAEGTASDYASQYSEEQGYRSAKAGGASPPAFRVLRVRPK